MKKSINIALLTAFSVSCLSTAQTIAQQKAAPKKAATPAATKAAPAAKAGGFKKLPGGVEYKIVKDVPGKNAVIGDFMDVNILIKADTATLRSSRKENQGKPVSIPVNASTTKADFSTVLPFLSVGDSAVIHISMDTIIAANPGQQMPPFMKKGKKLTFEISVAGIKTKEEYQKEMEVKNKEMQEGMKVQAQTDDKILQDYFKANNITATKTASGLYYVIHKEGDGALVAKGQKVSVNYTGKLMDGKMFDSNTDPAKGHVQPFEFSVGMGSVIPGWDEGLTLLKKGSNATLYIPSPLAYGPRGAGGDIGPNSVLMFDIEVLDIKSDK